ncbi:hypothetical protein EON66_06785 [archaeon]|nr:MAG: hypothetical protein EON66_06785 [archaeon]
MQLNDAVIRDAELRSGAKAAICERIAAADKWLVDGADEELQLTDIILTAQRAVQGIDIPEDHERIVVQ